MSTVVDAGPRTGQVAHRLPAPLLVGGVCGLAWASALRGFMAEVAGPETGVHWMGTFGWILAPGLPDPRKEVA